MSGANYAGTVYEQSKYASRGLAAVAGLAAITGVNSALGQEAQPIAYKDTNLSSYGVPNFEGITPYKTKFLDRTDAVPGNETRRDAFKVGYGFVATMSIDDKVYEVGYDRDGKRPLDFAFRDENGSGYFERVSTTASSKPPKWTYE